MKDDKDWNTCTGFIAIALLSSPITESNKDIKVYFRNKLGHAYVTMSNEQLLQLPVHNVLSMTTLEYKLVRE